MTNFSNISGVYAAAVTPIKNSELAVDDVPLLLEFLAKRGCHGALLFGTTGEGPSFSLAERKKVFEVAVQIRQEYPEFRLLAGAGTPSLEETIAICRAAFDTGMDGVVVLPPYYFRKVTEQGLYQWFEQVLLRGVPAGQPLLGYHIPPVSGVALPLSLLARLRDHYPDRFAGIKDSSADPEHARQLGERFGSDLVVLNGNDRLFNLALEQKASGCITAMANVFSPELRKVWDAFQRGESQPIAQERLSRGREFMDRYPPAPPLLKRLLADIFRLPQWQVHPPLVDLAPDDSAEIVREAREILLEAGIEYPIH